MPETPEQRGDSEEAIAKLKEAGKYNDECKALRDAKDAARKDNIQEKSIDDIGNFKYGYGFQKFRNVTSSGDIPNMVYDKDNDTWSNPSFVNTDFPMMRYADVLLMAAECQARGASIDGYNAFNQVRERAGVSRIETPTLDQILDERARELYAEGHRWMDLRRTKQLVRYNIQFSEYISSEAAMANNKGEIKWYRPIPANEISANTGISIEDQNPGY